MVGATGPVAVGATGVVVVGVNRVLNAEKVSE